MKDVSTIDPMLDDIGAMIDEALACPDKAEEVKARIRERLSRRTHLPPAPEAQSGEEPDDFWENVPI